MEQFREMLDAFNENNTVMMNASNRSKGSNPLQALPTFKTKTV